MKEFSPILEEAFRCYESLVEDIPPELLSREMVSSRLFDHKGQEVMITLSIHLIEE
ncbi:MAG: hypothetical protein Q4B88_06405 [Moraxella sp.]|nr:hypothetical protein [Moraxella sp.]